jgi:hypothetical protein
MPKCPFNGCTNDIPSDTLACRYHWRRIEAHSRKRIDLIWRRWLGREITVAEMKAEQQAILDEAVKAASVEYCKTSYGTFPIGEVDDV